MPEPTYIHKTDHRNASPAKSQWTISMEDELRCFMRSTQSDWRDERGQWSLHLPDGEPEVLGKTAKFSGRQICVKICRFVTDSSDRSHGFPADYRKHTHERPTFTTLVKWHDAGFIAKHEISKVLKAKPCSLSD